MLVASCGLPAATSSDAFSCARVVWADLAVGDVDCEDDWLSCPGPTMDVEPFLPDSCMKNRKKRKQKWKKAQELSFSPGLSSSHSAAFLDPSSSACPSFRGLCAHYEQKMDQELALGSGVSSPLCATRLTVSTACPSPVSSVPASCGSLLSSASRVSCGSCLRTPTCLALSCS